MNTISHQEIVLLYETVARLTDRMVMAARAGDWETLARLESDCTIHAQRLSRDYAPREALSDVLRERKYRSIKKILSDDREIRDLALPWSVRLSNLLNGRAVEPAHPANRPTHPPG